MEQEIKLEKALSPTQVTALALGSIVGWGCFVLPGDMFLPQAGPLGTLLGFLAGAILISFVGVCYSYMIKYAPVAGGAFTYAYVGYGPTASFICGWSLVIGYIAIVMIDIAALSLIFRFLFPGVFEFGELYTIAGWKVYVGEVLLMFAGTAIFGWLNLPQYQHGRQTAAHTGLHAHLRHYCFLLWGRNDRYGQRHQPHALFCGKQE